MSILHKSDSCRLSFEVSKNSCQQLLPRKWSSTWK